MGQKQQQSADSVSEPKKRRRVAFADADAGIDPNECIKIYLVLSKEEVEAGGGYCIDPIDLGNFFEEDGKIYGYVGLKVTFWVSTISFHAYVDLTYESTTDAGKGITDLKTAFQNIFGENLVEDKDQFLQLFSTEKQYIRSVTSKGEKLPVGACNGNLASHSNGEGHQVEVVRLVVGDMLVGQLYSRLVPLVLLLVDGSSPLDVTDSGWEIYLIVQKKTGDQEEEAQDTLLGLAATYRFYRYPDTSRLRLSQILILPPYQRHGYGRTLLELLHNVAISEGVYDFTIEEPLDSLQHVRNCLDIPRLLACSSVQEAVNSVASQLKEANLSKRATEKTHSLLPQSTTIEEVRKSLKINKKQFIQCWEILIYLALDLSEKKHMDNFKTFITDRVKESVLGKDSGPTGKRVVDVPSEFDQDVSFVMYKPQNGEGSAAEVEGDQAEVEQQLEKLVDERIEGIKSVAKKAEVRHRAVLQLTSNSDGCWLVMCRFVL
ncbi:hypothetical protein V2J09_002372 [Rumex salicifolius]